MLPWHPSGPRTPALPPTADAPQRTPRIPGLQSEVLLPRTLRKTNPSPPQDPRAVTQHRYQLWCCSHSSYSCACERGCGPFIWGVSSLFQHWLHDSHTHSKNKHKWPKFIDMRKASEEMLNWPNDHYQIWEIIVPIKMCSNKLIFIFALLEGVKKGIQLFTVTKQHLITFCFHQKKYVLFKSFKCF